MLDQNPEYNNSFAFTEFSLPGKGMRQGDMLIIKSNAMFLIEIKGQDFSKVYVNGPWKYINKKGSEAELIKTMHRSNDLENPYEQASNTADSLVKWIKQNKFIFYNEDFKRFLESKDFKIFPIVYIRKTNFLKLENIQLHPWCELARGIEELPTKLNKKWLKNDNYVPIIDENSVENLADALNIVKLTNIQKSTPGRDNETLFSIILFLSTTNLKLPSEQAVLDKVFSSGEKRINEVRKAINRGIKEQTIIKSENGYILDPDFQSFLNEGWNIQRTIGEWSIFTRLEDIRSGSPTVSRIFINKYSGNSNSIIRDSQSNNFVANLDLLDSLAIFSFDKFIRFNNTANAVFFRPNGPTSIDFEAKFISDFIDHENNDIFSQLINFLETNNQILIIGSPFTGKTTLTKLLGINYLKNNYPVIYLTPTDLDREAVNQLTKIGNQKQQTHKLYVIIENIHLATATELNWIKNLLYLQKNLVFILTSRKKSIYYNNEDFVESMFNEECL